MSDYSNINDSKETGRYFIDIQLQNNISGKKVWEHVNKDEFNFQNVSNVKQAR